MPIIRKMSRSGYLHICQKSFDNGIIFYVLEDFLVFLTILSVKANACGVIIYAIVLMFNHLHIGAIFNSRDTPSHLMNASTSVYARLYNKQYGLKGQLFKKPFRSAPKVNDKKIRDNLFYIWNNPKEKKAVQSVEEYRWNLLKYLESDHPFSNPVNVSTASDKLLRLMRKVTARRKAGKFLGYDFFGPEYKSLPKEERQQLIDFIIVSYNVIQRDVILAKFGSYQSLVLAANSVTGSEYDLADDNTEEDYRHYRKMISISKREGINLDRIRFSEDYRESHREEIMRLRKLFRIESDASEYEINKFFHLL
jgi:REP element-mobilizing transposase RayT